MGTLSTVFDLQCVRLGYAKDASLSGASPAVQLLP